MRVYVGIFLATLSTVFLPVPEEATLLGAGYYVRLGSASLGGSIGAAWLAIMLGDAFSYFVGRELLARVLRTRWGVRVFPEARRVWGERLVAAHGVRAIFVGRFLVGLRGFVYFALGSSKFPLGRFLAVNALAGVVEVGLLVAIGFGFGGLHASAGGGIGAVVGAGVGRRVDLAAAAVLFLALFGPLIVPRLAMARRSGRPPPSRGGPSPD